MEKEMINISGDDYLLLRALKDDNEHFFISSSYGGGLKIINEKKGTAFLMNKIKQLEDSLELARKYQEALEEEIKKLSGKEPKTKWWRL